MLMTAQPLHAFDLDKVPGGEIIVRTRARRRDDDDARRHRADASTPTRCSSATATGPPGSPGSWAAWSPRSATTTTRVLLEVATWNGVNILRTSRKLGLRSDASNRNEKQLHPELALRAQRVASRLMVELCGARLVPGTIDAAAEIPERAPGRACAAAAPSGCSGSRSRSTTRSSTCGRLEFEVEADGEDLEATVPFHRHYDVTREADLIEEVGRIHGYAEHLPATLPPATGERRRADAASSACAAAPRTWPATSASTAWSRSASPTPAARAAADRRRRSARRADRDLQPALARPLGAAHDAARRSARRRPLQPRPRRARASRSTSPGRAYLRAGEPLGAGTLGGNFPGERPAPAYEPWRLACLAIGAAGRRRLAGRAGGAGLLRAQGRARGHRRRARLRGRGRARRPSRSCSPGRAGAGARRRRARPAGSGRSTRSSAGPGTSRPRSAFELDLAPLVDASPQRRRAVRGRDHLSGGRAGHRGRRRRGRRGGAGARGGRRGAAASCCARSRSSTSTAASRSARGTRASPCGSSSAPPTGRSPTRRSPRSASGSRRRWPSSSEGRCVAEPPTTGGRRRRLRLRRRARGRARLAPSAARARRGHLAQRGRHAARPSSTRATACPVELTELDLDAARGASTRRSSPTRTAPPRRWSPRCAGMGLHAWSTSRPTSGSSTPRSTSAGTRPTASPSCSTNAVYGLTELDRERIADCRAGRQPRLLSDRGAAGARAARRARAGRVGDRRRQVGRLRRRARRRRAAVARQPDRELHAVRDRRPPPPAGDRAGAEAALGADVPVTFVPHLLPIDQGLLASCYVDLDASRSRTIARACTPSATPTSRSSRSSTTPPGVRDVRDTNLCRIHAAPAGRGSRGRLRRDRQPLEGRGRPGDPEPQPDARARRDARGCDERA